MAVVSHTVKSLNKSTSRGTKMPKKKTHDEIIAMFREKHGDFYDYSLVVYKNMMTKVKIICPVHGVFEQVPNDHARKHGCKQCAIDKNTASQTKSRSEYITQLTELYGDQYDYSNTVFPKSTHDKITVRCMTHGDFTIRAWDHLRGYACQYCSGNKMELSKIINQFVNVHGDKYDYSKINSVNSKDKVEIVCPIHGSFWQLIVNHRAGRGCKKCSNVSGGWYSLMSPEQRQTHKPGYVYIVRMVGDDGEVFDKIGITKRDPKQRFEEFAHYIPIGAEVKEYENIDLAFNKEKSLHEKFSMVPYKPKHWFGGAVNECFECLPYKFHEETTKKWLGGK